MGVDSVSVRKNTVVALLVVLSVGVYGAVVVEGLPAAEPEIDDDLLYDRVNRALITDRLLGSRQLAVRVSDGVVTVSGFVETEKLKKRVEKVVKKVDGVEDVRNEVKIRPY